MTEINPALAPQVSILIAAWSAEAMLERAITSALGQSVRVEVIVINDASPDGTGRVAEDCAKLDPRVRVLHQVTNSGPSAARNAGLAIARAPWVTILDADDFFCDADRLAKLLAIAEAEAVDFVADDLWKIPEDNLDGPRTRMLSETTIGIQPLDAAGFVLGNLSSRRGGRRELGFLKPLVSREFLTNHRLAYDEDIRMGEDYVLYAQALIVGARFVLTDPAGYAAVVRTNSLSGHHPTEAHEKLIAADKALLALPGVNEPTRAALRAHLMEQHKKWAWRRLIDAKRAADPAAALACFWAPPAVIADLIARIWGDAANRLSQRSDAS